MKSMTDKKKLTIARILIISGVLIAGVALFLPETYSWIVIGIGIAIEIVAFGYAIIFVRCSFCRHSLPLSGLGIQNCPYCGKDLSEKEEPENRV